MQITCYSQYEVDIGKFWDSVIKITYRVYSICKCFMPSNLNIALTLSPKIIWRKLKKSGS